METNLNGIVLNGKFYEAVKCNEISPCKSCALHNECAKFDYEHHTNSFCIKNLGDYHFRFSSELTEKLKGE